MRFRKIILDFLLLDILEESEEVNDSDDDILTSLLINECDEEEKKDILIKFLMISLRTILDFTDLMIFIYSLFLFLPLHQMDLFHLEKMFCFFFFEDYPILIG